MLTYVKIFGYLIIFSLIYSKSEIQFSANILENLVEEDIEKRIFRDDVIIKKDDMTLFTDEAIYIPSESKVILSKDVRMYHTHVKIGTALHSNYCRGQHE